MRVIIESPFAGKTDEETARNEEYLNAALAHSLDLGEFPVASHAIYTRKGVLDDKIPEERKKGIDAGFAWREVADKTVFYGDRGISQGMILGLEHSIGLGIPVTFRSLGNKWRIDHPPEASTFSEPAALMWLRTHPTVKWQDKNKYGWMNHMTMMFGGVQTEAFEWNGCDVGKYIIYQGLVGEGYYMVDVYAVNERLRQVGSGIHPALG